MNKTQYAAWQQIKAATDQIVETFDDPESPVWIYGRPYSNPIIYLAMTIEAELSELFARSMA